MKNEYIAEIFIKTKRWCDYKKEWYAYSGYQYVEEPVKVNADSFDEALKLIEEEAYKKFPKLQHFVHINQVTKGNNIVYDTVWDAHGPLCASGHEDGLYLGIPPAHLYKNYGK